MALGHADHIWDRTFGLIIFGMIGLQIWLRPSPKPAELITPENIEAHMRDWLDGLGLVVQRQPQNPQTLFNFLVRLHDGTPVTVARLAAHAGYFDFESRVDITQEHVPMVAAFTKAQAIRLSDEIDLEMASVVSNK